MENAGWLHNQSISGWGHLDRVGIHAGLVILGVRMSQQLGSDVERQSKANINKSTNPGQLFLFKEEELPICMSMYVIVLRQSVNRHWVITSLSTRPEESRCV